MKRLVRGRNRGFTLVEVLIAMVITVLILTAAFLTFSNLVSGIEVLRRSTAEIHSLNRLWMFLSRDLRQFVDRPVRNEFDELEPALWGGESAADSLNFTRTGWHNPQQFPRSTLQRVRYLLEDQTLFREHYGVLDRTGVNEPQRVALLESVSRFEIGFLAAGAVLEPQQWDPQRWPVNWGTDYRETGVTPAPQALVVTLEVEGLGEVTRLYQIAGSH